MGALKFDRFGGQIPVLDDRLLPMGNAAYTENAFLQSGSLEPLAADVFAHELLSTSTRYAFRVPINEPDINGISSPANNKWIEFSDANTTVVRGPVANTADGGRFYWANASNPPGYTTKARLIAGSPALVLGLPAPTVAPTAVPTDTTTAPLVTRAYVYTWVSDLGEETQPSPPSILATGAYVPPWNITVTAPVPAAFTGRSPPTKTRIYRTEVATDGLTVGFFFVAEIPIATLTFSDAVPGDIVNQSEQLKSEDWAPPPADLAGMVSMPNGMIAGWRKNEVWFCEPYRPHAWPLKYTINVDADIVGLGTIDQNLLILTAGQPYSAAGIHPEVMALRKVQPLEPCTAQGSIVSTDKGVLYTSNNGLILIGPAGGKNLTFDIIRKDDWADLLNLGSVHATFFMNGYYCYSSPVDEVFQADAFQFFEAAGPAGAGGTIEGGLAADVPQAFQARDYKGTMRGMHINLTDERLGIMTLRTKTPTLNVMLDIWTGETLVIREATKQVEGPPGTFTTVPVHHVFHVDRRTHNPRQSYKWRSKIVDLDYVHNLAAAKVEFGDPLGSDPADGGVKPVEPTLFKYYADGKLRLTYPLTKGKSGKQFRLPSGFKADNVQFELEGQFVIFSVQAATSARELRKV